MRRHIRDVRRTFLAEGVEVLHMDHLGNGHIRFTTDAGPFVIGSTPSDHRWHQKFKSHIRRSKK